MSLLLLHLLGGFQQVVEGGTATVAAREVVVAVNAVYLPALVYAVLREHLFLIGYAVGVVVSVCLEFILLRQTAVDSGFVGSFRRWLSLL